ncbi:hydrolase TatD [Endozoicomonas sp. (ex Bugula neritina AB1)]|nr:hydrolase TatD [Endozoicomonas sp. (ex Bugula neritina AB1)]
MFIDSHCHLDRLKLDDYDGNLDQLVAAARQANVSKMLCVSVDLDNVADCVVLADQYDDVVASVGVHPLDCKDGVPDLTSLNQYLSHPKVVAVGETGLDYYYSGDNKSIQQESFINHLELAKTERLPVIIHTRDARDDTLQLMKEHGCEKHTGVLHCFTESWDMAKAALDMNYYISISGIVTFRNATELGEVVKRLPMSRLLIETDAPYLAPVPHRGKSNEPRFVVDVATCVAELKGVSVEELAERTTENFYHLFNRA